MTNTTTDNAASDSDMDHEGQGNRGEESEEVDSDEFEEGEERFRQQSKYDAGGFVKYSHEEIGNVSEDEEENARLIDAGFTNGLVPAAWEVPLLKGSTFKNWKEFDEAVEDYEARSGYRFRRTKKKKNTARGVCRGWQKDNEHACKVEISARCLLKTGVITIRKVYLSHTCSHAIHKFRSGANKTAWVARTVLNHVRSNPNTPINEVRETMRTLHGASTEAWTAQRARVACREKIAGGSKETFYKIPAYISALRAADPEGHAIYQTGEDQRFARLFIAPASSMNAAKSCCAVAGLVRTHTTGKFPMVLLFATCFDAENQMIILAWGLVSNKNGDNWTWFLEQLCVSYLAFRNPGMVFISDCDKDLQLGVAEVFPNCYHAHCVQHLRTNIKGNVDMVCSKYFKQIVEAKTETEYEKLLTEFKSTSVQQEKFVGYVRKIIPQMYARHAFPVRRYGHYTSNVVELINTVVKPCRVMPALLLSDYIWCYVMEKHYNRAVHAKQLPDSEFALTQYADNILNHLYEESQGVKERCSSENESLMVDNKGTWVVRINDRHCDCLDWQEYDFPCIHAIRWLLNHGKECREYVGQVWLARTQQTAYSIPVPPISIDQLSLCEHPCLEPLCPPEKKGKQSGKRKPSWGDQQVQSNDRVKKQSHKCRRCGRPGHNARSCMYQPPEAALSSITPAQDKGGSTSNQAGMQATNAQPSHETVRVGDAIAAQQPMPQDSWNHFHDSNVFL